MTEVFDLSKLDLAKVEHGLGLEGCGAVALRSIITEDFHRELVEEIEDPSKVIWRDAGATYTNARGVLIEQNHDVFALKLSQGDQSHRMKVPKMDQFQLATQELVRNLSILYPALAQWTADEMSYHSYYDKVKGLTSHRDNKRFVGLIAVGSILGECDFQVIDREPVEFRVDPETQKKVVSKWYWKSTYTIPTYPRDLVLTRAPGLLPEMNDDTDRPEHAVMNIRKLPRVSGMVRANNRASETGYGFEYHNWDGRD